MAALRCAAFLLHLQGSMVARGKIAMANRATVRDVMTTEPIVLDGSATVYDADRAMKVRDVGDVLVSTASPSS